MKHVHAEPPRPTQAAVESNSRLWEEAFKLELDEFEAIGSKPTAAAAAFATAPTASVMIPAGAGAAAAGGGGSGEGASICAFKKNETFFSSFVTKQSTTFFSTFYFLSLKGRGSLVLCCLLGEAAMRLALGLTLSVAPSNRAGDVTTRRAAFPINQSQRRRLALGPHRPTSVTSSRFQPPSARSNGAAPRATATAAAAKAATSETALGIDHPAFSPVVSLPLPGGGGSSFYSLSPLSLDDGGDGDGGGGGRAISFLDTLVVRPLHPSDVTEATEALLRAFEGGADADDPLERPQLERRLERESRRYCLDPGPWLLHSVSLPPPKAPPKADNSSSFSAAAAAEEEIETEEEEEKGIESSPWWSSLPSSAATTLGLPGSLKRKQAAELERLAEEKAAAAWEEALEDAWGRWLWLVAEARSSSEEEEEGGEGEGEGRKERRKIVGAAALLFHDRSSSLRALERLSSSEFGSAIENKKRWPRPDAMSMDYCLWLRERFPEAGWPPNASSSTSSSSSSSSSSGEEGVFGRCASLWWVGTLPEARGKGVGAALLDASAAVAAAAGFPRVFAQVEEWSGSGGARGTSRGRRSGGLAGAPWLGSEPASPSLSPSPPPRSPVERMYRSAGFVAVPDPPRELGRRDGGAVDRSAVLLQKEIW